MTRALRARDEAGTALVEFTWLALILLVPLLWIVISVFEVQRGAFAVSAAARAAGRAYALAPSDAVGEAQARAVVAKTLSDQGGDDIVPAQVSITCTPDPANCHQGTSVITVRVESGVELPLMPDILGGGAPSFALDASHTVPIGQYVEQEAP